MCMRVWNSRYPVALLVLMAVSAGVQAQCPPQWFTLGSGFDDSGSKVLAITAYNGDLIAGGTFVHAGGVVVNHIARWDGQQWQPLGSGMDARVEALTVYNGELYAGGQFLHAGGVAANYVARWDGVQWQPLGAGTDGEVASFTTYGGELIVGGAFTNAGGQQVNSIARWNGSQWGALGTGLQVQGDPQMLALISAMTIYQGDLIAGGSFNRAGTTVVMCVARWDGQTWNEMGTLFVVNALAAGSAPDQLYAGIEAFNEISYLFHWSGSGWEYVDYEGAPVRALQFSGDQLYVGGLRFILRWDGRSFNPLGSGVNGDVWSLGLWNGDLIVGGAFTQAGGQPANRIARWGCQYALGDLNCDGLVNFTDINPFVLALTDPAGYGQAYPNCYIDRGDLNGDGRVDFNDINPFVERLAGS